MSLAFWLSSGSPVESIPATPTETLYVVFDIGQSNSAGRAEVSRLALTSYSPTPANVFMYYKPTTTATDDGSWQALEAGVNNCSEPDLPTSFNMFGAEVSLGALIANSKGSVYYIKAADGGTSLAQGTGLDWSASSTNELLDIALQRYWTVAVQKLQAQYPGKTIRPVILWHQGESDALDSVKYNAYGTNFAALVSKIRAHDSLLSNAPLVITKIYYRPSVGEDAVNAALQSYADTNANAYTVDISDMPRKQDLTTEQKGGYPPTVSDDEHNSYLGQIAKGERIFDLLANIGFFGTTT